MSRRDELSQQAAARAQRTKTYTVVCHGCGRFHEIHAEFLSAPQALRFPHPDKPETEWTIPTLGCPECMATPRDVHGNNPISRAFKQGMTPEARARANAEFLTWLPKLEARAAERQKAWRL